MLFVMASPVRFHDLSEMPGKTLIMRLIIGVFSAMLFVIGLACASFGSAEEAAALQPNALMQSTSIVHIEVSSPADADTRGAAVLDSSGSDAVLDSALCALAVICGLVFIALLRKLWHRPLRPDLGLSPFAPPSFLLPRFRLRETALTLSQLSLSRT